MKYRIKRICHNDPSLDIYYIQRKKLLRWKSLDEYGEPAIRFVTSTNYYYSLKAAEEAVTTFICKIENGTTVVKNYVL